jgi:hypothetical protein
MSTQNLAIVVAPTLMRPRGPDKDALSIVMENEKKCRIIDYMLNNAEAVFSVIKLFSSVFDAFQQQEAVSAAPISSVTPMTVSNNTANKVAPFPTPHVEQGMAINRCNIYSIATDDDFGYFSDIMDLCVTGNHIEKVQAAQELAGLFLDGKKLFLSQFY